MKKRILSSFMAFLMICSFSCILPENCVMNITAYAISENDVVSWMSSYNGKTISDGGTQCVAAFNSYLRLFGITNPIGQYPVGGAKQIFDYPAPVGWQKINGSGNYCVGDIVIWNGNVGGGYGHVGMVYSTSGGVKIFDQNWVVKNQCGIHNISSEGSIRGVFRPPLSSTTGCSCSGSYAGTYEATANGGLIIRSGHGTGYGQVGTIPKGAQCTVTKGDGTWAHVSYNGVNGYSSMQYLKLVAAANHSPIGNVDSVSGGEGCIHITGWAFDEDNSSKSLEMHVYIGGPCGDSKVVSAHNGIMADQSSADVTNVYGVGGNHRFDAWISTTARGSQEVFIYAIDANDPSGNKLIGTGTANITEPIAKGHVMAESEAAGQTIPNGEYWIINELGRNVYLDIPGIDYPASSGSKLIATNGSELPPKCDSWILTYLNNGFYKITQNGQDIAVDVPNASLNHKTKVQTYKDNETVAQQWSIKETIDHGYSIQSRANGYYLDVANATIGNDGYIQTHEGNGSKAQSWCFVPFLSNDRPVEDGEYCIKSAAGNVYLDADGDYNYKNGSNIQIWNDKTDCYSFKYVGDGYYTITESTSGLAVEVEDVDKAAFLNRKNIQLGTYTGERRQIWRIVDEGNGNYRIVSKLSGYSLDLAGMKTANGSNVQQHPYNTSNAQKWSFEKVHEHSYTEKVVPATCTSKGYTLHTCTVCGDSYKDNETELAAHKFGAWTTTVEPTTTTEGAAVHKCTVCGKEETKTLDKLPQEVDPNAPQIVVDSVTAGAGNTVKVNISLKNNPGIAVCTFAVNYDPSVLTLESATSENFGAIFSQSFTDMPYMVSFANPSENITTNGTVAELTFKVNDKAAAGDYPITVTYDEDEIYKLSEKMGDTENVHFEVVDGKVKVMDYLPGDINMDGKVNMKDVTRLHQYVIKWPVEVNLAACDTNGDGKINMKDVTRLHQFVIKWPVEIH